MQNGGAGHAWHDVDRLVITHQHRVGLNNALKGNLVSRGDFLRQRCFSQLIQRLNHLHIALPRRGPVEMSDRNVLLFQVVAEQGDADVNHIQRLVK